MIDPLMKKFTGVLAAALFGACFGQATALAQDEKVFPYEFHVDDLPNGLRLITIPTEFPDIIALHVLVGVGSRNEVEGGRSGFAHFFEHVMFRGTENYTSTEQAAVFKRAGADRNAYTTDDFTNYHTTFAKEDLDTVLMMEADRFQHLKYSKMMFRTESQAVFGEYNKNSANPINKIFEVVRDTAYSQHTYKHTTMGFLRDIVKMPRMYDYSLEFFKRWYNPENTTILLVGDLQREQALSMVRKHWGEWKPGGYTAEIPVEPKQEEPLTCHIPWSSPTQPWVVVCFKGPAFAPDNADMPTLDVLQSVAFSQTSPLYNKLYIKEQKVESLFAYFPDHKDPYLLMVMAKAKNVEDLGYVRDQIIATCEGLKTNLVDSKRLVQVCSNLRYRFAAGLDSSEGIASALSGAIARTRTPATINKVFAHYAEVTPESLQAVAKRYFLESGRTVATLCAGDKPEMGPVKLKSKADHASASKDLPASRVLQPSQSPLVSIRLLYATGAADDPAGKEGLAYVTARMLCNAATRNHSYEEILAALYPMAAGVRSQVDKEMTVFSGTVHRDNLQAYYELLREMLLEPAFAQADLNRVVSDAASYLDDSLRRSNDEETGKEILYQRIYGDHVYGHHNQGSIESLNGLTLADVKEFYTAHMRPENLLVGLSGGYPKGFAQQIELDLGPAKAKLAAREVAAPVELKSNRLTIVKKQTRATGIHIGFPISITRSHPDWPALWLVRSYLGEHRSENSFLYQRLREIRGLNYGDYAYIEYFPNGGSNFHPAPNLARQSQIFQIWIRPVLPENGLFAFKAANYELRQLVEKGMSAEAFTAARAYLSKFVNLLVKTQDRKLGYAIDSAFYEVGDFAPYVKDSLAKLDVEQVNRVIRKCLRSDRLQYVVVTEEAESFRDALLAGEATPISYQSTPGQEVLDEDKIIESLPIDLSAENVEILPVDAVFQR